MLKMKIIKILCILIWILLMRWTLVHTVRHQYFPFINLLVRYGSKIAVPNGVSKRRSARLAIRTIITCPVRLRCHQLLLLPPLLHHRLHQIHSRTWASIYANRSIRLDWPLSGIHICQVAPCYRLPTCINFIGMWNALHFLFAFDLSILTQQ